MTAGHWIAGCWVIFLLYWIVNAAFTKPTAQRLTWASNMAYRLPLFAGSILLFVFRLPRPLSLEVMPRTAVSEWSGAAFCTLGLLGAVWARRTLAGNWSSDVTFKQGHNLVERGPYRLVRHPIYTSLLLMALGTAVASARLGSFVGLPFWLAGFWIKLKHEETILTQHFPAEYPGYKTRVKALVPFVL